MTIDDDIDGTIAMLKKRLETASKQIEYFIDEKAKAEQQLAAANEKIAAFKEEHKAEIDLMDKELKARIAQDKVDYNRLNDDWTKDSANQLKALAHFKARLAKYKTLHEVDDAKIVKARAFIERVKKDMEIDDNAVNSCVDCDLLPHGDDCDDDCILRVIEDFDLDKVA